MSIGVVPFLLGASASLTLAWTFRRRIRRIPDRTVYDTIPYLRALDYDSLDALLDAEQEEHLHANLGHRKFREAQKKRIKLLLNYLDSMKHNANALREWGSRDRRRGVAAGETQWQDLGDNLVQHSINLRGGIFAMSFVLHRWLLQVALLPFLKVPHISTLRKFDTFDLFENYQQMVNAALDLGLAYGDEVHQKLAAAL